ncbi:MAG: MFS transporter [Pseudobdellovibrionaceae bacterium]
MIWPYIFLSYSSLFVFGLTDNVRGPLFPEILKDFAVSDAVGSWMFALGSVSGFLASYGCHYLLKRYDRLTVLQTGAIGLVLSMWGMSISPFFSLFLFFSFFFGLSTGVIGLIPNILVALGSSAKKKQQMLSGLHTMYGLSSLLAPLLAATVEHFTGSWRWTFAAGSIAPICLLIYSFHSTHKDLHTKADVLQEDEHKLKRKNNLKPQLFLAMMLGFAVATEIMVSSRLALYMQRERHFDMESSSLYVTFFFIFMMLGRLLFSIVHFRRSPQFMLTISLLLSGLCLFCGIIVHPLFLTGIGFTIAPFYPLAISWVSSEFPDDLDAAVAYTVAADSIMLIVMHLLIGKITDTLGIRYALLFGLSFVLLSILMVNTFHFVFKKAKHPLPSDSL